MYVRLGEMEGGKRFGTVKMVEERERAVALWVVLAMWNAEAGQRNWNKHALIVDISSGASLSVVGTLDVDVAVLCTMLIVLTTQARVLGPSCQMLCLPLNSTTATTITIVGIHFSQNTNHSSPLSLSYTSRRSSCHSISQP